MPSPAKMNPMPLAVASSLLPFFSKKYRRVASRTFAPFVTAARALSKVVHDEGSVESPAVQ